MTTTPRRVMNPMARKMKEEIYIDKKSSSMLETAAGGRPLTLDLLLTPSTPIVSHSTSICFGRTLYSHDAQFTEDNVRRRIASEIKSEKERFPTLFDLDVIHKRLLIVQNEAADDSQKCENFQSQAESSKVKGTPDMVCCCKEKRTLTVNMPFGRVMEFRLESMVYLPRLKKDVTQWNIFRQPSEQLGFSSKE